MDLPRLPVIIGKKSRPRASIAMCTYNGARYLPEQLESIAAQTQPPVELVICDDGSSDDTVSLISNYSKSVGFPVRFFSNKQNLGPAKNFEKAIRLCEGEIIILSDQDDIWMPSKIEIILEAFASHPDAVYVFSNADMVDEKGNPIGRTLWSAVGLSDEPDFSIETKQLELLLYDNFLTGAAMAFRASFRNIVLPIPSSWMHDYWIGILGTTLSHGIPIPERLFKYRRHAAQVCGWQKKTYWQAWKVSMTAGTDDAWRKLKEFRALLERLNSPTGIESCSIERLDLLRQKEMHLIERAKIRSSPWFLRIVKVPIEALTGRYSRFSSSPWNSIVRDFC